MGMEGPQQPANVQETKTAEDMLEPKERVMSEIREEAIKKINLESGLDQSTFEEIAESYNSEYIGMDFTIFSFELKGHKITGGITNSVGGKFIDGAEVDGVKLTDSKWFSFRDKYEKVILGLNSISTKKIEREAEEKTLDDIL